MSNTFCFKSIDDSNYGKEIKRYTELVPLWNNVLDRVGELIGKHLTRIARDTNELYLDVDELGAESKKLFTKDGKLKKNSKKSNELRKGYLKIIEEEGLSDYTDIQYINFNYGVIRTNHHQKIESFISSEGVNYLKANYNLLNRDKSSTSIEPITEIQFEEKYLSELKKRKDESK